MDPGFISKKAIKDIFKASGQQPFRGLGQNFLISQGVLRKIIESAGLSSNDTVLEIGPGLGSLTQELAKRVKRVVAVEKDRRMADFLEKNLKHFKNLEIIEGDILKIKNLKATLRGVRFASSKIKNYKVVANLPYYITSPVIRKFLESENQPKIMVLMVQKEVGQRIVARPPKMNLLTVAVQFYAKAKIIDYVSKNCFWPRPKVDSAILRIAPLIKTNRKLINADIFFKVVKAGFSQPRKQLANNLAKKLKLDKEATKNWLLENKINPGQRPETLSINNWLELVKNWTTTK